MTEPGPSLERPQWLNERLGDASGRGVTVAVVDSGLTPDEELLPKEASVPGLSLVDPARPFIPARSSDADDAIGHGTACARIVRSIAPQARIQPFKVFGERLETSTDILAAALDAATSRGARVINLSLGTPLKSAEAPLREACRRAHKAGCILVSALPFGADTIFPAAFDTVISVTAGRFVNIHDIVIRRSGDPDAADVIAAGTSPVVRDLDLEAPFGSSLAAPHVSGLIALLLERYPSARLPQVRRMLAELARPASAEL